MAKSAENGHEMTEFKSTADPNTTIMLEDEESDDPDDPRLPPLGSRNGKWWYSTIHNVTATVGAGVLALPTAMAYFGWVGGAVVLVVSWVITLFTLWQMIEMHENLDGMLPGDRVTTYHELGQKAFGKRRGLWIVLPQQLVVQVGADVVYIVTGGQCAWLFYQLLLCTTDHLDPVSLGDGEQCCGGLGRTAFTVFFALPQFFLSQLGSFNSIASLSLLACLMSVGYSTIAWGDSLKLGTRNHRALAQSLQPMAVCTTSYQFPHSSPASQVFGVFRALGIIAFSYAGHNVALEIQSTLPSTREKPSKILMWKGVKWAYAIVALCYFPVAFASYWAFGNYLAIRGNSRENPSGGNILLQLGEPKWLIMLANLMVVIHMTGSYQVYAIPVFAVMEKVLVRKFRFKSTSMMRMVTRSLYVLFTTFIACTFPFFNDLLAFFGGLAYTPTTYFVPCIIWLRLKRPKAFTIPWLVNWSLILIGVLLTIVATIGGFRYIFIDAQSKNKFSYPKTYLKCNSTLDFPKHCVKDDVRELPSRGYVFYQFKCNMRQNLNSSTCNVIFPHVQ